MTNKLSLKSMVEHWVKKVLLSFIMCGAILYCFSMIITYYNISEKYMAIALLICCTYYLYQILLITKIKCPNCNKALIFSLFTGGFSLNLKTNIVRTCNNCGKKIE